MAKISLRAYNREIENLIESSQTEEAIAHCKYILKQYPKHLDTYRLLGKGYLESRHHTEASDIFQRVLSVLPDDFISNLGMSIIREDEANLDAAIWHMERAYEFQPSNPAIQSELQRLRSRRDGVEPPKVRLTRGALVRMYERGELYSQAIAEVRAALVEDPKRIDLMVILARIFYLANQKVEATETCVKLISKLPYCYEANRILNEILTSTNHVEDAKTYKHRLIALDPYFAFTSENTPKPQDIPDTAITLERLDWQPAQEYSNQPEWAQAVGINIHSENETTQDWLQNTSVNEPKEEIQYSLPPVPATPQTELSETNDIFNNNISKEEVIPDWMQAAGWTIAQANEEKSESKTVNGDNELTLQSDEDISRAEIPDWLKQDNSTQEVEEPNQENSKVRVDQSVNKINNKEEFPDNFETLGDVVRGEPPVMNKSLYEEIKPPEPVKTVENWIKEENMSPFGLHSNYKDEDLPDWLKALEPSPSVPSQQENKEEIHLPPSTPIESQNIPEEEELPDWLKALEPPESKSPISSAEGQARTPQAESSSLPPDSIEKGDIPDWLKSLETPVSPSPEALQSIPIEGKGEDEIPEWLKAFEASESSVPTINISKETIPTEAIAQSYPTETSGEEEMPDWLKALEPPTATSPVAQVGKDFETELSIPLPQTEKQITGIVQPADDVGVALSWLESLTTHQVEPKESTFTPSEYGTGKSLEWIEEKAPKEEPPHPIIAESSPVVENVQSFEGTGISEAVSGIEEEVPPTHLKESPQEKEIVSTPTGMAMDDESAFAWLESLAARQGADEETLLVKPGDRIETPPAWVEEVAPEKPEMMVSETSEIPLPTAEAEQPAATEVTSFEEIATTPESKEELPDWLRSLEEPATTIEAEPSSSLPDWLKEIEVEAKPPVEPELIQPAAEVPSIQSLPETNFVEEPPPFETEAVQGEVHGEQELPDWLKMLEAAEEQPLISPAPEPAAEMLPIEPEPVLEIVSQPAVSQIFEPSVTEPASELPAIETVTFPETVQPVEIAPGQPVETEIKPEEEFIATPEQVTIPEGQEAIPAEIKLIELAVQPPVEEVSEFTLEDARLTLEKSDIIGAVDKYSVFIKEGNKLDEIIKDLQDGLYRHPIDINLLEALGDAFKKADRLQEALDTYTKAEELLR